MTHIRIRISFVNAISRYVGACWVYSRTLEDVYTVTEDGERDRCRTRKVFSIEGNEFDG